MPICTETLTDCPPPKANEIALRAEVGGFLTYRGVVYPWHCDHVGHMNVMWYVGKFDEATWQFFNILGLTPGYLRSQKRGMAAVDQHISYIREMHAGSVVSVRTALVGFKEKSVQFVHEMIDDDKGDVVAKTAKKAVHLDTELRKSCPFPGAIAAKMASLVMELPAS